MVIGSPVNHSLSPQLHNTAYEALSIDEQYIYVACEVAKPDLATYISGIRTMQHICSISCTIPHKESVMQYLDEIDPVAQKIGAVNTIIRTSQASSTHSYLKGYNTDWLGILAPLKKRVPLTDKKITIIGAGGAARAAIYGLLIEQASVTVVNRTLDKAKVLAQEFGCNTAALDHKAAFDSADIIINTTPAGMHPNEMISPIPKEYIHAGQLVFDIVYTPFNTMLLRDAHEQGADVIHGHEMLLQQAAAQLTLYTGKAAPLEAMERVLLQLVDSGGSTLSV